MTGEPTTPTCSLRLEGTRQGVLVWPDGGPRPRPEWFDPTALAATASSADAGLGRGTTTRFEAEGQTYVLRHYRRGGLPGRLTEDRYLRTGLRNSRPWRELVLLTRLHAGGMPVPPPVAARIAPLGPLSPWYRGDLVTGWLAGTRTLTDALKAGTLDPALWERIGETIDEFHAIGVDHADLNAQNILLDEHGAVYLIDFDRARLRRPGRWMRGNLDRLRRSLDKVQAGAPGIAFDEDAWRRLEAGYRKGD